jgi:hypothetical protein
MQRLLSILALLLLMFPIGTLGGAVCYGACQTRCNGAAMVCYATAGGVFGAVTAGFGTPGAILGCNASLGTCMASCTWSFLIPLC